MQTVLYTTTDQIRSMLGLTVEDMSDVQITDRSLDKELSLDLASWISTHATIYSTGRGPSATTIQSSQSDALQLYCAYYCAYLVAISMQMAAPQAISDGKNAVSRFSTIDWAGIQNRIQERLAFYKKFLQTSISATAATRPAMFSVANLTTDPVTGA